jgi:hypothetical protein
VTTGTTTSPPTTTSPRRMMVTQLGSTYDGVIEFEEVRAGVWQEHHLYVPQNYNAFFIEHAMLTPDGSQLVLLVQSTSTDTQLEVWIATRQTLLDTFNTITMLYADPTGSPDFPFLTVDCRTHLYFSIGDQIHHVIL